MTKKIVRLTGSRSADERISEFLNREPGRWCMGKSRLDRTFGYQHRELKDVEGEVKELMTDFLEIDIASDRITRYLELQYPEHHEHIINPPHWVFTINAINTDDSGGAWKKAGRNGQNDVLDTSMYAHWRSCEDLNFVGALAQQSSLSSLSPDIGPSTRNMFETLADLETETASQHSSDATDLEDDHTGSDSDDEDLVEARWQKTLMQEPDPTSIPPQESSPGVTTLPSESNDSSTSVQPSDLRDPATFFFAHGCDAVPVVPTSDRALDELFGLWGHLVNVTIRA